MYDLGNLYNTILNQNKFDKEINMQYIVSISQYNPKDIHFHTNLQTQRN